MRWPWTRRKKTVEGDRPDHSEAQHALARAIEDKKQVEAQWLPVVDIVARLDHHAERNGFGQDIRAAMRLRRRGA